MKDFYGVLLTEKGEERFVTAKYTTLRRAMTFGVAPLVKDPSVAYLIIYRISFSTTKPWNTFKLVKKGSGWHLKPFKYSQIGE